MPALDCTDIKALLSGLVDDEVDTDTRHAAERHLADCRSCRTLIDEAEALGGLIAAETDAVRQELPADFADAVLGRTVRAQPAPRAGHGWTNWLGWLAAAASLVLAATLFVMDRPSAPAGDGSAGAPRAAAMPARSTDFRHSYVFDGDARPAVGTNGAGATAGDRTANRAADRTADAPRGTMAALVSRPLLARDDAETLDSAALALETLLADDGTFARLGEIRYFVDYEELLPRLADARQRLSPADRPALFACESALFRIRYGSDDPATLAELAATIEDIGLAGQLTKISSRWAAQSI